MTGPYVALERHAWAALADATQIDLDEATLQELRVAAAGGQKVLRWFDNDISDRDGEVVARVHKQLYLRRKPGR